MPSAQYAEYTATAPAPARVVEFVAAAPSMRAAPALVGACWCMELTAVVTIVIPHGNDRGHLWHPLLFPLACGPLAGGQSVKFDQVHGQTSCTLPAGPLPASRFPVGVGLATLAE